MVIMTPRLAPSRAKLCGFSERYEVPSIGAMRLMP